VACAKAIMDIASQRGLKGLHVGVVTGDDILDRLSGFIENGIPLAHMESGVPLKDIRDRVISANVYFGPGQ